MAESTGKVTGDGKRGEQVLQARGTKVAKQKCNKDIFIQPTSCSNFMVSFCSMHVSTCIYA